MPGSLVIEARPPDRMIFAHVMGAGDDATVAAFREQVARLEADTESIYEILGEILGLSRERVRQIESRAEAKCRRSVRRER